ncbi:MAG: hypothetical protein AAF456_13245 [Planctomycetota bacterium]
MSNSNLNLKDIFRRLSNDVPDALKNRWRVNAERSYIDSARSEGVVEFDWRTHRLTIRFALSDDRKPILDAAMDNEFPPNEFSDFDDLLLWVVREEHIVTDRASA